jgi:hypothetical protein
MGDARIRVITIAGAVAILLLILELVRRRKLKEEYSVLWVMTAVVVLVLALWYDLLDRVTRLIGGSLPSSTLFFFGLVFILILLLHFSVRISSLERRMTALIQELGLMTVDRDPPTGERPALEEAETPALEPGAPAPRPAPGSARPAPGTR